MAKKRRNSGDKGAVKGPVQSDGAPPIELTPDQQDERRDQAAAQGRDAGRRQIDQLAEMRLDMMRSIITEPLLSEVRQTPDGKFDVIIVLNELFSGGIARALAEIEARAKMLEARYATVSHYCFACLTGRQILDLAREARGERRGIDARDRLDATLAGQNGAPRGGEITADWRNDT